MVSRQNTYKKRYTNIKSYLTNRFNSFENSATNADVSETRNGNNQAAGGATARDEALGED